MIMFENRIIFDVGNEKTSKSNLSYSKHINQMKKEKELQIKQSEEFKNELDNYFNQILKMDNNEISEINETGEYETNFKLKKSKSFMYGDDTNNDNFMYGNDTNNDNFIINLNDDENDLLGNTLYNNTINEIIKQNKKDKSNKNFTSVDRLRINQFYKYYTELDKDKNIILKKEISNMIHNLSEDIHKIGLLTIYNSRYKYPRIVIYAKDVLSDEVKNELNRLYIPYTIQYHFYSTDNLSMKSKPVKYLKK